MIGKIRSINRKIMPYKLRWYMVTKYLPGIVNAGAKVLQGTSPLWDYDANFALIQALLNLGRLKKGDAVGFSAVTWSTNVMPLIQLGLRPVPVDVELETLNVSSRLLKESLERQPIKALFLTDLLGFCSDIDEISNICRERGIILLEDNCESFGTVYKGRKLGNWGLAGTFSFYVGHHLSTIEGGAVATDDEELATMLRMVRAHGWDRNLGAKEQAELRSRFGATPFYGRYTFYDIGDNLRPTEINGFLGNAQLRYAEEIIQKRNQNFLRLASAIYKMTDKYVLLHYDHIDLVSNFAFPLICKSQEIRDQIVAAVDKDVEVRPIVGGDMTQQPFFRKYVGDAPACLNAKQIHESGFYFGNNPELSNEEIEKLINVFA